MLMAALFCGDLLAPLDRMRATYSVLLALGLLFLPLSPQLKAQVKDDVKDAGRATEQAGKDVGHATATGVKKTGKAIKKGTKKAAHAPASATEKGADKVRQKTQ
jgi:hypothetical protein